MLRLLAFAFFAPLLVAHGFELTAQDSESSSRPDITSAEIEAHVRRLASDEFAGRKTGTEGTRLAAEYIASEFERSGLKPAGDDGTYFQSVPMERVEYLSKPSLRLYRTEGDPVIAFWGRDFDTRGSFAPTEKLEIALALSVDELPTEADPSRALFINADRREARAWTREHGLLAVGFAGMVIERGRDTQGRERTKLPKSGRALRVVGPSGPVRISLRGELLGQLLAGEFTHIELEVERDVEEVPERNVVAILPGVGTPDEPELARETIVFSAHYDHIGTRTAREGEPEDADLVYNGADDDASGVSAVLELAQAFQAAKAPARTLVFLLATGEEIGLLGTEYYLDHPVVPLDDTILNANIEMIGRPDDAVGGAGKLWLTGYELSTLAASVEKAGVPIAPDARPDQNFFRRSDNYAFVKRGIVGQTFSSYNLHGDYHQVADEADEIDFEHMQTCVRAIFQGVQSIVDGSLSVEWAEGVDPAEL